MKIGVVIHYSETNYGNHLVNLAVRRVLERRGHDIDLLDISGESRRRVAALRRTPLKLVRLLASGVLLSRIRDRLRRSRQVPTVVPAHAVARKTLFQDFADSHLRPVRVMPEARHSLSDRYDCFAVGSDQIWNYDYGLAPWHFLDFADPSSRFTLSPSVGHDSIPLEWRGFYRRMLAGFDEIGVRETRWASSLRPRSTAVVLTVDPTLLITADEWRRIASGNARAAGKVLVYELGSLTPEQTRFIEETAKLLGTEVVHLSEHGNQALWSSNAADFLALIDSAACVITDSYHGAIFSFLFDRPLVILQRHGFASAMNSRIQTLCERLHLEDRMIDALIPAAAIQHDYSAGQRALVSYREEFEQYLDRHTQDRSS